MMGVNHARDLRTSFASPKHLEYFGYEPYGTPQANMEQTALAESPIDNEIAAIRAQSMHPC
jgi:hypothetical protein